MDIFDDSGQLTEIRHLEYDYESNRVSYISTPPDRPSERVTSIEFSYDELGNRNSRNLLDTNGGIFLRYETLYDSDGYATANT